MKLRKKCFSMAGLISISCAFLSALHGQEGAFFSPTDKFIAVQDSYEDDIKTLIKNGDSSYKIGLFPLAKNFFATVLKSEKLSHAEKAAALVGYIESCLAEGNFNEALLMLPKMKSLPIRELPAKLRNGFLLRIAMLESCARDISSARRTIANINLKELNDSDLAWYHVIETALVAEASIIFHYISNPGELQKYAISADQEIQIQAFMLQFALRMPLTYAEMHELHAICNSLREKQKRSELQPVLAETNALLLIKLGDNACAEKLLNECISSLPPNAPAVQSLLLYKAFAKGLHRPEGYEVVVEILLSKASDDIKKQSLKLLISSAENISQKIATFDALSNKKLLHTSEGILRQILFSKIALAIDARNLDLGQKAIEELLLAFPQEPLIKDLYGAIAYSAWDQDPRDYRMAAHYFGKMRDLADSEDEKGFLTAKIGDAFYLSGAYDLAAQVYGEILRKSVSSLQHDKILCHLIQANIKAKDLGSARKNLINFREKFDIFSDYRWQAELLFINELILSGNVPQAMEYVAMLVNTYAFNIQPLYLTNFYLLQAHSMFREQNYQRAHVLAARICEILPKKNAAYEANRIISQALFIKGACEFKLNEYKSGAETFSILRKQYPEYDPASLSYFEQAEFLHKEGKSVNACKLLEQCATSNNKYAPFAYYKSAEYYKYCGQGHYGAALANLSALISKHKEHSIIYAARLEMADILRLTGEFGDAQLIYESLIKDFPLDPRNHFTEFCLSKAMLAQKNKDISFISRARIILERLYSSGIPEKSLHYEITATYVLSLRLDKLFAPMKKVAWTTLLSAVSDGNAFSENDLYWLLQIANLLNDFFSDTSEKSNASEHKALYEIIEKINALLPKK